MTADEIKRAIARRHGADNGSAQWVCIEEAWCFSSGGVDVLAIGAWQTAKAPGLQGAGKLHWRFPKGEPPVEEDARYPVVAYEVKVSRADMRRELYGYQPGPDAKRWRTRPVHPWPAKAAHALERSHYFMFAVPKGLLKDEEIERRERPEDRKGLWLPGEAGLVEVDGGGCHVRAPAPRREARPLRVGEIAELIRHALKPNRERALADECARLRGEVTYLRKALAKERGELYEAVA